PHVNSLPPPPAKYFLHWMILAPQNANVSDINELVLEQMAGEQQVYISTDKVI
ncbi:hypothetical protein BDQ12DRAFT_582288, partial [Crucibulum laeve]